VLWQNFTFLILSLQFGRFKQAKSAKVPILSGLDQENHGNLPDY
tara:strand:- start:1584 stop:1715 length:132 start_codon:yes stop_codon:yes gene_type:complete